MDPRWRRTCWFLPSCGAEVVELDVQQGEKGGAAERAAGVQVGVVSRPAGHYLLVVHQSFAGVALAAAGHQHLAGETKGPTGQERFQGQKF